jgi:hypothetical protein
MDQNVILNYIWIKRTTVAVATDMICDFMQRFKNKTISCLSVYMHVGDIIIALQVWCDKSKAREKAIQLAGCSVTRRLFVVLRELPDSGIC